MKKLWIIWRTGILTTVPVLVIIGLVVWLFNWLSGFTAGLTESRYLNLTIDLAIVILLPLIFGWLIGLRWFRILGQAILGKLPLVGPVFSFLFNHDYVKRIQNGDLQEVVFPYAGSTWGIGGLVNTVKMRQDVSGGPLVEWCVILGPPTTPLAPTAQLLLVRKSDVVFTGRSYRETILTVASFGFNFEINNSRK
ncbi:MAG: hypothetical protein AAB646_02635 [Patescibacteria group bacterium]